VSTTANYYIKTAADDVRDAMAKLEGMIQRPSSEKNIGVEEAIRQERATQSSP